MKHDACVTRVVQETPQVRTIYFTVDNTPYAFIAGQYLTVFFDDTSVKHGKAYSISSAPGDAEVSITVKNIGEFSGRITALEPGDHFTVSSPYGFFNADDDMPIVAIAAGVGIAPIWSIIRNELSYHPDRNVALHLSAPTRETLVFRDAIDFLFEKHANANYRFYTTREGAGARRMVVAQDIPAESLRQARFYICGSEEFARSMWRQLMEAGVDETCVVTEIFFESTT